MSAHAPRTQAKGDNEGIATVSATGMPRIIPRHTDKRSEHDQAQLDDKDGDTPAELQHARTHHQTEKEDSDNEDDIESVASTSEQEEQEVSRPDYPPTGSLTLAAFNPHTAIPLSRRLALIAGSVFINLGLPFLNGVMLGFGEIFARVVVAPALGITGVGWAGDTARAVANWHWPPRNPPSAWRDKHHHLAQESQPGDFDDWSPTAQSSPPSSAF